MSVLQTRGIRDMLRVVSAPHHPGKISLPINSNTGFVSFKNITGYASADPKKGYSINKLKILDTLVESLKLHRRKPLVLNEQDKDPIQIDQTIENLISQLETVLRSTDQPFENFLAPNQGQIVDFLV